jgi:hypothetical protein
MLVTLTVLAVLVLINSVVRKWKHVSWYTGEIISGGCIVVSGLVLICSLGINHVDKNDPSRLVREELKAIDYSKGKPNYLLLCSTIDGTKRLCYYKNIGGDSFDIALVDFDGSTIITDGEHYVIANRSRECRWSWWWWLEHDHNPSTFEFHIPKGAARGLE